MNKVNLKYLLYCLAVSIALYLFINMFMLINSSKVQAFSIVRPMEIKQVSTNQISNTPPASFNYELAAVRLGESNTSVIVKKGGKEYVESYKILLPELVFKSVNDSINNSVPTRIGIKKGHCDININRRPSDNNGNFFVSFLCIRF